MISFAFTCCVHSRKQTNKFQTNCKQILTNNQPTKQTNRAAAVASGVVEHLASVVVFAHSTTRSEMRAALEEHLLQGTRELSETDRAALAAAAADVSAAAGDDRYTNAPWDASFSDNSFDISRAEGGGRTSDPTTFARRSSPTARMRSNRRRQTRPSLCTANHRRVCCRLVTHRTRVGRSPMEVDHTIQASARDVGLI
jgi:hypothetical protein